MSQYNPHPFAWETDDMLEPQRLILILEHLPYQIFNAQPESRRGRNDYPIRTLFRAMIAGVAFRHYSVNYLLR